MPSLGTFSGCFYDIATIQPSLQAHLVPLGAQSIIIHAKTLPNPWRQSTFSKSLKFYTGHLHVPRGRVLITAVATVETKYPAQKEHQRSSSLSSSDASNPSDGLNGGSDDGEEVDDRERLRRMRISKANRGNTPWNKGRKHSPETLQKIRERTKIAMQDPKIKMKLSNLGHAQNEETRLKIGEGVRMRWARRKERRKVQETCHFEWQNLLAEAARKGYTDEQEFQWDSYKILDQQNQLEWLESIEQRKAAYRERVCSGLAKYHGIPEGAERRRRRPSGNAEPRKKSPPTKTTRVLETVRKVQVVKVRKRRTPVYKDPLASSKLEMIKSIRAKRVAEESKKMDAVQRARLLISEAEKAAKVLEVAAMTSPVAHASLLESKKLIAEATQLIESLEISQVAASDEDGTCHQEQPGEVNGTHTLPINGESLHLNLRCSDLPQPNGTRVDPPSPESNGAVKVSESPHLPNGSNTCHGVDEKGESLESGNVTKKWVRGRLVEVTEAA
ncbi:hypothetical protein HID58_020641 [Brassica napus]|uniref:Nuclease associated modular domain-containing protein n=1 Tax=Brassica napus TaxID=3708 RepID=A0ABQ8CU84_BRANA|nr:hypothetical protein HID58_020641 [Brassica napus]